MKGVIGHFHVRLQCVWERVHFNPSLHRSSSASLYLSLFVHFGLYSHVRQHMSRMWEVVVLDSELMSSLMPTGVLGSSQWLGLLHKVLMVFTNQGNTVGPSVFTHLLVWSSWSLAVWQEVWISLSLSVCCSGLIFSRSLLCSSACSLFVSVLLCILQTRYLTKGVNIYFEIMTCKANLKTWGYLRWIFEWSSSLSLDCHVSVFLVNSLKCDIWLTTPQCPLIYYLASYWRIW